MTKQDETVPHGSGKAPRSGGARLQQLKQVVALVGEGVVGLDEVGELRKHKRNAVSDNQHQGCGSLGARARWRTQRIVGLPCGQFCTRLRVSAKPTMKATNNLQH